MKPLLGGKGAGLAEMTNLGLPVPPGFTITTTACTWFFSHGEKWPDGLVDELDGSVSRLEEVTGKKLGSMTSPLFVSVRSGAAVSMPGMMDTVLNLGLNDETVHALAQQSGEEVFAWDSYRRFISMFGDVVLGIHYTRFSRAEERFRRENEVAEDDPQALRQLCEVLKGVVTDHGHEFPQDPRTQLTLAIDAVFRSYNSHRARYYRKTHQIPDDAGTGVNVQAMVFGNMGEGSGTGVAFTRDPKSGSRGLFGEWLPNAQGEDVVAGLRTPYPLDGADGSLERIMPEVYAQLQEVRTRLEAHLNDMQDIEFTIERGRLFLLQTRNGKRTALAGVQIVA